MVVKVLKFREELKKKSNINKHNFQLHRIPYQKCRTWIVMRTDVQISKSCQYTTKGLTLLLDPEIMTYKRIFKQVLCMWQHAKKAMPCASFISYLWRTALPLQKPLLDGSDIDDQLPEKNYFSHTLACLDLTHYGICIVDMQKTV